MAKRIVLIVIAFTVAVAVIFTGCTPARKPMNTGDQYNRTGTNGNTINQNNPDQASNWGAKDISYNNRTALDNNYTNKGLGNNVSLNTTTQTTDNLERTIEQVQGVRDATVVVSGNTAYVGLVLDTNTANASDIKNKVTQQIRSSNRAISTVYVSTETSFIDRLRNVGTGISGGKPISGFTTELRDLVRRINPVNW